MITRLDIDDTKTRTVITRAQLETDLRRGYCGILYAPAGELVVTNPRNPVPMRRPVAAVHLFRCMRCQFDAADSAYPPDDQGAHRTGKTLIQAHLEAGKHPWPYPPFESPYGNVEDVIIEGVADYTKEIVKDGSSDSRTGNSV